MDCEAKRRKFKKIETAAYVTREDPKKASEAGWGSHYIRSK